MEQYVIYNGKEGKGVITTLTKGKQYKIIEDLGSCICIRNDKGIKKYYYRQYFTDEPAATPPVNGQQLAEELWDKYSYHVDDDIDSLQMVAGSSILREHDFKALIKELLQATYLSPSPAKAEQPFNRDENSVEGKAAIEFYEWLKRTSVLKTDIPINIKWRMFVDQKNVKQRNNQ